MCYLSQNIGDLTDLSCLKKTIWTATKEKVKSRDRARRVSSTLDRSSVGYPFSVLDKE